MNIVELESFPRVRLGHTPTPIDAAPNLSESLGVEVHVKRDDCTGLAFGGNKVRQLEFYLGAAKRSSRSQWQPTRSALQMTWQMRRQISRPVPVSTAASVP